MSLPDGAKYPTPWRGKAMGEKPPPVTTHALGLMTPRTLYNVGSWYSVRGRRGSFLLTAVHADGTLTVGRVGLAIRLTPSQADALLTLLPPREETP